MFVVAMKTTRTRLAVWGMALLALVAVLFTAVRSQPRVVATTGRESGPVAVLRELGYDVPDRWSAVREVVLPQELTQEWAAYQEMQIACGYDLTPYLGERVKCYTYQIGQGAQANLYEYEDNVIAGDILIGDRQMGLIPQGEAHGAIG